MLNYHFVFFFPKGRETGLCQPTKTKLGLVHGHLFFPGVWCTSKLKTWNFQVPNGYWGCRPLGGGCHASEFCRGQGLWGLAPEAERSWPADLTARRKISFRCHPAMLQRWWGIGGYEKRTWKCFVMVAGLCPEST